MSKDITDDKRRKMADNGIPIVAVSKRDGSIIRRFGSARQAAAWGECDEHTVSRQSRRLTLGSGDYMWRREDSWEGCEVFNPKTKNRPVVVMAQGHLLWFSGPTEAAAALGVAYTLVTGVLNKHCSSRRFQAVYLTSTEDWPRLREQFGGKLTDSKPF